MTPGHTVGFAKRFSLFLSSSLLTSAVNFLMLPLATIVLGPEEYGTYALVGSITLVGQSLNALGSTYLLAAKFRGSSEDERSALISTLLITGLLLTVGFGVLVVLMWPLIEGLWPATAGIPTMGVYIALLTVLLSTPWSLASDVVTLEGMARKHAAITIAQSAIWVVGMLLGLFVLHWGVLTLFVAAMMGGAVQCVGAMLILRGYAKPRFSVRWLRESLSIGLLSSAGSMLERIQTTLESYVLSTRVGIGPLGIFSHARQYRNAAMMGVSSFSRSLWPTTLDEARDLEGGFERTRRGWAIIHLGLTILGLFFAVLGAQFIGLITHGKFSAASDLVVIWILILLVQASGRSAYGSVYAFNEGRFVAKIAIASMCLGIGALFILVPVLGMVGALLAVYLQHLAYRLGIQFRARRLRGIPFDDGYAIFGSGLVLAGEVISQGTRLPLELKIGLFVGLALATLLGFRKPTRALVNYVGQVMHGALGATAASREPSILGAEDPGDP